MHDYLWPHGRCNGFEMAWAICASLAFHVVLVLILSSASDYFLPTGEETRFDVIWATPSTVPLDLPAAAALNPLQPAPQLQQEPVSPNQTVAAAQSDQLPATTTPTPEVANPAPAANQQIEDLAVFTVAQKELPVPAISTQAAKAPTSHIKHSEAVNSPEKTSTRQREPFPLPVPVDLEKPPPNAPEPERSVAPQNVNEPSADRQDAGKKTVQVEPKRPVPALEKEPVLRPTDQNGLDLAAVQKPESAQLAAPRKPEPARLAAPQKPEPVQLIAARKPEPARLAADQKAELRPATASSPVAPLANQREIRPAGKPTAPAAASKSVTDGGKPQSAKRAFADIAQPEQSTKSAEKPHQARGPVIAALRGDLKLIMTGDTGIKLSVKFRAYPKSRRNKVLTRAESRQELTIAPVLAAPREDTREAVIETAREGIYLFSAEPVGGKGAKASFTLKIFEAGPRERTAVLGSRSLSGSSVLVKILMPEAILWDDESAFSGSMEDSESETKFNATTGLYWKEYHE